MRYFVAHLKDGRTLRFEEKATYVTQLDGTACLVFGAGKYGNTLAIIPIDSLLWVEACEKGVRYL